MTESAIKSTSTTTHVQRLRSLWQRLGMIVVFLLIFSIASIFVDHFLDWKNLKGLGLSVCTIGIVSCTMLFCLAAGDFDLSVGSVAAMTGVLSAIVMNKTGSVSLAIGCGVLAGGFVGVVNGFVIARLGINALITTLATMQIVRGFAFIFCGGPSVGVSNENFFALGLTRIFGIDLPIWIMILFFVSFGVLLSRTVFGRNTLAVGGNYEAARLAGIRTVRLKIIIFTLQGLVAGFAGVVLASRQTSGQPNAAVGLELQVISACVLGGVSLTGGVGSMPGVVVGVLIMGTVNDAMNLRNIPSFWQMVASGCILLAAVLVDRLQRKSSR